jgi:polyhydroxybutyrate depolymerase
MKLYAINSIKLFFSTSLGSHPKSASTAWSLTEFYAEVPLFMMDLPSLAKHHRMNCSLTPRCLLSSIFGLVLMMTSLGLMAQETFFHDGLDRSYFLELPDNIEPGAPLVIVLHGYTSGPAVIYSYSGWSAISAAEGVAVCYPEGTLDYFGVPHWNANLGISDTDDLGFLVALAEHLQTTHNLSPDCTFVCGMSNGGFMSYSLACHAPSTFRAIGSVTGLMSASDFQTCNPETVVPVVHLHGTNDLTVSYTEGTNDPFFWGDTGMEETMDLWTGLMGTTLTYETPMPNEEVVDLTSVDFIRHYGAAGGQEFHHYRVNGGGHEWFGSWGSFDIQSTQVIWDFFSNQCSGESTSTGTTISPAEDLIYSNGQSFGAHKACQIEGYDALGRMTLATQPIAAGEIWDTARLSGSFFIRASVPGRPAQIIRIGETFH